MIKRPLNARFSDKVPPEIKTTTIRDKVWPVGVPIMLYNWSGAAYRSKQIDVAAVIVTAAISIDISRDDEGNMTFSEIMGLGRQLWETEGFNSRVELDDWFRPLVKPGQTVTKALMRFRLYQPQPSAS